MLGNYNKNVKNVGVAKMLARRKPVAEESANNDECPPSTEQQFDSLVRLTIAELGSKCLLRISQF